MSALHYLMFGEWPTVEYLKAAITVKLIILALLLPFIIHIIKKEKKENEKSGDIN